MCVCLDVTQVDGSSDWVLGVEYQYVHLDVTHVNKGNG